MSIRKALLKTHRITNKIRFCPLLMPQLPLILPNPIKFSKRKRGRRTHPRQKLQSKNKRGRSTGKKRRCTRKRRNMEKASVENGANNVNKTKRKWANTRKKASTRKRENTETNKTTRNIKNTTKDKNKSMKETIKSKTINGAEIKKMVKSGISTKIRTTTRVASGIKNKIGRRGRIIKQLNPTNSNGKNSDHIIMNR